MKLVFATNNLNKLEEVRVKLGNRVEVLSLHDIGYIQDLPEDYDTLEENAFQKAETIFNKFNLPCFADDTGLEVVALNGAPGVYSARFAGPECSSDDNIDLLLQKLQGVENRKARFRTVIAYINEHSERHSFEGVVEGEITYERHGIKGFGYDPVFKPVGYNEVFAEMSTELKNEISHRGLAVAKFVDYLLR